MTKFSAQVRHDTRNSLEHIRDAIFSHLDTDCFMADWTVSCSLNSGSLCSWNAFCYQIPLQQFEIPTTINIWTGYDVTVVSYFIIFIIQIAWLCFHEIFSICICTFGLWLMSTQRVSWVILWPRCAIIPKFPYRQLLHTWKFQWLDIDLNAWNYSWIHDRSLNWI